jgi:hypothetical protein
MNKLVAILASIISIQINAFEVSEFRGRLVTNYQDMDREAVEGFNTLAIENPHGAIQELAVPVSERIRFLKRFSGKDIIVETGATEGMSIPVALNMAIFLKDTQVTYWTNATESYYKFPQKVAMTETNSENIAGLVDFDSETVSDQASGFTITTKNKIYKVAKADRNLKYSLNALRGQVATFTIASLDDGSDSTPPISIPPIDLPGFNPAIDPFGIPHNWGRFNPWGGGNVPFSSSIMGHPNMSPVDKYDVLNSHYSAGSARRNAAVNKSALMVNPIVEDAVTEPNDPQTDEQKPEEDLIHIESIIKPMQTGTVEGKATLEWDSGNDTLKVELADEQKINLAYHKKFHKEWSDQSLASSVLRVNYRVVILENGSFPMVESYEVVDKSEYEDNHDDFMGP